ncbi:MAG: hypothetical protein ABR991_02915 [Terracidiphilus sp.]|jgi:hypothetical protein
MKSVDKDYGGNGYVEAKWLFAYSFMALGAISMFVKIWEGIHFRGFPHMLFHIVILPLLFISPLIFALLFRRYIRSALKEQLASERVAENCEYWIGQLIGAVYFSFFWFSERLVLN